MIKFELEVGNQGVEILLDANGIDELIRYLQFIKLHDESLHLTVGNELNEEESQQNGYQAIKHVKLIYVE
jgi:hypothetical protein